MVYQDRTDAGRVLAKLLAPYRGDDLVVLGLPRGGVPVALEVAEALDAPLDVFVARKLTSPRYPEFGFGAVAGDVVVLDSDSVAMLGLDEAQIEEIVLRERDEAARREALFRNGRAPLRLAFKTVLVIDDGLATGVTARAACQAIRKARPARLIFAAPVCASDSSHRLRGEVDEVVCAWVPPRFAAVGEFYANFSQTSDEEVVEILARRERELRDQRSAERHAPEERPHDESF